MDLKSIGGMIEMNKTEMIEAIQKTTLWKSVNYLKSWPKAEVELTYKSGIEAGVIKTPVTKGDCVKTKEIVYCKCGQAVRLRKRDGKWVHYGYKRMHEPYAEFLERTDHLIEITGSKIWQVD